MKKLIFSSNKVYLSYLNFIISKHNKTKSKYMIHEKVYKVVMLPTNQKVKKGDIITSSTFPFELKVAISDELSHPSESISKSHHLYLTSDEEIINDDWVLPFGEKRPWKFKKAPCPLPYWGNSENCKKIVATTDRSLGLPLITDSFVEEYCKSQGDLKEVKLHYLELITSPYKEKTINVSKELLEQICKYCEDQAFFDKLSEYGDFYYKLKSILKS